MHVKHMIAPATMMLLLAGCGDEPVDAGAGATDTGIDTTADVPTTTLDGGGVVEGDDSAVLDPFGPVTCQCHRLSRRPQGAS